jgi:hypothetical protein
MLNPKGDLSAAELAFFSPALLIGVYIIVRHGFSRRLGWLYIVLLSILRIIGASCTLYMETNNDYTASLLETAAITSAVGTTPLLLALMGFLERINQSMDQEGLSPTVVRPIQLLAVVGLVLAIVGGTYEAPPTTANQLKAGRDLMEAASIIFLCIYLALAAIAVYTQFRIRWVVTTERRLLLAGLLSLPFLLVRMIYTVCAGFSKPGSTFYFQDVNVWAQAFMQFLMEAIVVSLYIFAGILTPKVVRQEPAQGTKDPEGDVEMNRPVGQETGYARFSEQQQQRQGARPQFQRPREQRNLGDYRPSRLILSAIRDRR